MTVRNKFEEMLERLVNEDRSGAEEMFHEIVVERSREIYEKLLAEEAEEDEDMDEATDEEVDESDEELDEADDEEVDEAADEDELDENFFDEAGDETGDMTMDIAMPGDEMGGDDMDMGGDDMGMGDEGGDVEDRVADLEDELEALKAEFEALMGDEAGEEADDEMDMGDEEADDMDMGDEEGEEEKPEESFNFGETKAVKKSQAELMREYANKVAPAKMGDNGANAKSIVAGKNDMGGTTANIAKGSASKSEGTAGGLANNKPQTMNTKNVNTVGGNGASKLTAQPKGHGAEKKGAGENAANKGSVLNGAPKRAK